MKNSTVKEITIQLIKASAKITAELHLEETVSLDGQKMTIPCCDITIKCEINEQTYRGYDDRYHNPIRQNGMVFHGVIDGKVALTEEHNNALKSMLEDLKQHPAWIAKEEKKAAKIAAQQAAYQQKKSHVGWCDKCGSYCYGDCEANG